MKFILFIIFITLSFIHLDAGDTLKVTTLNIRRSGIDTGEMRWEKRKWILKNYIDYAKSDILCIQEGLLPQINFIDSLLDLEYVGVGRDDGKTAGEYCAIFYRSKKLKVLESGTFWLSPTSNLPSMGWDAACQRICTWALIKTKSGKVFYTYNTHLDHVGIVARQNAMRLINSKLNLLEPDMPVIFCGDLNDSPDSKTIEIIKDFYTEANEIAQNKEILDKTTFNGFDKYYTPIGKQIDYIFLNKLWKVLSYKVNSEKIDNQFVSDHFPVEAILVLEKNQ